MKKNKLVKLVLGTIVLLLIGTGVVFSLVNKSKERGSDEKIAVLADNGMAIVSISSERKMINTLVISPDVQIWIPGGLGWYRSSAVKKILQQEKKTDLFNKLLFYNLGFVADKTVVLKNIDDWKRKFWWQYFWNSGKMILKEEIIKKDIKEEGDLLDEVMIRDFSESKLINEDIRLSIINTTNIDGLADFMANNLERLGFSVISVGGETNNNGCQIVYGDKVKETFSWKVLKELIDCPQKEDLSLNEGEVELYFDEKFASMIKYPSYK